MKFGIGQAVRRTEDVRLVTGNGQFTDDLDLANAVHCVVLRSPYAHAKITSLDVSAAKKAPGVVDVLIAQDFIDGNVGPLPCLIPLKGPDGGPLPVTERWPAAKDTVRFVGDPVAYVIADSVAQGYDAAEQILVDYDPLDVISNYREAADSPVQIWDTAPGNLTVDWEMGDQSAVDAAIAGAAHVVSVDLDQNRIAPTTMEPRVAAAEYDAADDHYTFHVACQGVNGMQMRVANMILHVPAEKVRVQSGDVGGGFGMKMFDFPEYAAVLLAARRLGRPVKWTGDRTESFLADTHGRESRQTAKLALDSDGKIQALKIVNTANLGAYHSTFGPFIPTLAGARIFGGVYSIPAIYGGVKCYLTNTAPVDAYRGAGRPEAAYLIERLMDAAGRETGLGPIEVRKRNFIQPDQMPLKNWMDIQYDSGEFERNLDDAVKASDYDGFDARKAEAKSRGKLLGRGLAYYIEITAADEERAQIRFTDNGGIELIVGTQSNGQGHETTFAQVVAERLGVPFESITVRQGDTDFVTKGGGTGGSRSIHMISGALNLAIGEVIEQGKKVAGHMLEAPAGDIAFDVTDGDGRFAIAGTDRSVGIGEVVQTALKDANLPDDVKSEIQEDLGATGDYEADGPTLPNGCHICETEIDAETGVADVVKYTIVDDFGRVVNPMIVAGQVHGGVVQGIGQALHELVVYDETGQLLTGSFMDYQVPRADDIPSIDFNYNEILCPNNPIGVKGCGEAGTVGSLPATMNAVADALKEVGVEDVQMPATPQRIWQWMNDAKST